jgi:uncharacterized membrane protein
MSAASATIASAVIGSVDSHARALAKAVSWRAVGTADTFFWGWIITGHPGHAGAIASLEVLTKIALFYVHERLWRLVPWAPNARWRSFMKAVSWRVVGSIDTFTLSFFITGSGKSASLIAIAEVVTKIGLYYVHERLWRKVAWGRLDAPAAKPQA